MEKAYVTLTYLLTYYKDSPEFANLGNLSKRQFIEMVDQEVNNIIKDIKEVTDIKPNDIEIEYV